jgi:hypothetical protein
MEFEFIDYKEYLKIKKYEMEIFDQLVVKEIFEVDKNGDLTEENGKIKIIGENKGAEIKLKDHPFQTLNGMSNLITDNDHFGYLDVFSLDESLQYKNGKILVCYKVENKKKIYQGCTWIFENSRYIAIYGIRTSLNNFLTKQKGTATEILKHVIKMADSKWFKRTILIPWPLEGMVELLKKFELNKVRFTNIKAEKENPDTNFLSNFTCTWNYWKLIL